MEHVKRPEEVAVVEEKMPLELDDGLAREKLLGKQPSRMDRLKEGDKKHDILQS